MFERWVARRHSILVLLLKRVKLDEVKRMQNQRVGYRGFLGVFDSRGAMY